MLIIVAWIAFALGVGWIADQRGRSQLNWTVIAVLISPLIAVIALALIPTEAATVAASPFHVDGMYWTDDSQAPLGMVCGGCHRKVSPAWKGKCKHCGMRYAYRAPLPG
jgi:hypothetical protein